MQVEIEFFRVRGRDDARAVVGRQSCDAVNSAAALGMARSLATSLDMPQTPDFFRICDTNGAELHRVAVDHGVALR